MARDGSDADYMRENWGIDPCSFEGFSSDNHCSSPANTDDDNKIIEYMKLNTNWSYVIRGIYDAYNQRGYLISKEEKALRTMMNRDLGQQPGLTCFNPFAPI